jgi:hypothetical protein
MHFLSGFAGCMIWMAASVSSAQAAPDVNWEAGVRKADHSYWDAYNRRDPATMNSFLADEVEFYHDRGGTLIGMAALGKANSAMKTSKARLRRALVPVACICIQCVAERQSTVPWSPASTIFLRWKRARPINSWDGHYSRICCC